MSTLAVRQTQEFQDWLDCLKDVKAQLRIVARLRLAEAGNLGDWKPVGNEVSEMRIAFGPGYRLYFTKRQNVLVVMPRWRRQVNTGKRYQASAENLAATGA